MDETVAIIFPKNESHEEMVEFSKHKIKCHPFIMSIFFRFLVTSNISEPLQEISQMKRYIKVLRTKSDLHHGRLAKIEELGKPGGWLSGESSKLARP